MARRTYGQFCVLAHALDAVGERWTLLIVRELNSGPKRYSQLLEALSGIGTSLLAARLRQLEVDDIVARRLLLDQPHAAVAYELTGAGHELAQAVVSLTLWGTRHHLHVYDDDINHEAYSAEWSLAFLIGDAPDVLPDDVDTLIEFRIENSVAFLHIRNGCASVTSGECATPSDAMISASAATIAEIAGGRTPLSEAAEEGRLRATGDATAIATLRTMIETKLRGPA